MSKRPQATALPVLLVTLLACVTGGASAAPDKALEVPVGFPVQIDGRLRPGEWADALSLPFGHPTATLRVKQLRGTLMIAFEADEHWMEGAMLTLTFASEDASAAQDLGAWTDGAFTVQFDPVDHNGPHLLVTRQDQRSTRAVRGEVVGVAVLSGSHAAAELVLPLSSLGIDDAPEAQVRFSAMWVRPGAKSGTSTIPEGLDVRAQPGTPPRDLGSNARWLRLSGFKQVHGHGAYSPDELQRFLTLHDEIARRGAAAYALYREMDEERRQFKKQDSMVQEIIIDALHFIAEHEALTDEDRLLLARAFAQTNRGPEALAILDGLLGSLASAVASRALYDRASVLHDLERFEEEARTWERLAAASGPSLGPRYLHAAASARELIEPLARERTRREENDGQALPLVELRTNRGRVILELYADDVPKAVAHFLALVRSGFYDGLRFHRVTGEFLAQVGDPITRGGDCSDAGRGSSEARVEIEENRQHGFWRGAVGFAVGMVQENGSQFFLLTGPRPDLQEESGQAFTCFGRVIAGMDVVDRIEGCDTLVSASVLREPPPGGK